MTNARVIELREARLAGQTGPIDIYNYLNISIVINFNMMPFVRLHLVLDSSHSTSISPVNLIRQTDMYRIKICLIYCCN